MADPTWPPTVNDKELLQSVEQARDDVVRSVVDTGVTKTRPRSTIDLTNLDVPMIMSETEKADFRAWYRDDLARGSLAFTNDGPDGPLTRYKFRSEPAFTRLSSVTFRTTLALLMIP